jgi:hypothetical protein
MRHSSHLEPIWITFMGSVSRCPYLPRAATTKHSANIPYSKIPYAPALAKYAPYHPFRLPRLRCNITRPRLKYTSTAGVKIRKPVVSSLSQPRRRLCHASQDLQHVNKGSVSNTTNHSHFLFAMRSCSNCEFANNVFSLLLRSGYLRER